MNISGFSSRPGFETSRRTLRVRVSGSTLSLMRSTRGGEMAVGIGGGGDFHALARTHQMDVASRRHPPCTHTVLRSTMVMQRRVVALHELSRSERALDDRAGQRRAHGNQRAHAVGCEHLLRVEAVDAQRFFGARGLRLGLGQIALGLLQRDARGGLVLEEILGHGV